MQASLPQKGGNSMEKPADLQDGALVFQSAQRQLKVAQVAGNWKGYNEALSSISRAAKKGHITIDQTKLGPFAVKQLKKDGFKVSPDTRTESGDQRGDSWKVSVYLISWE